VGVADSSDFKVSAGQPQTTFDFHDGTMRETRAKWKENFSFDRSLKIKKTNGNFRPPLKLSVAGWVARLKFSTAR
jgi:hypothetical protein